jgi:hypothetical protein
VITVATNGADAPSASSERVALALFMLLGMFTTSPTCQHLEGRLPKRATAVAHLQRLLEWHPLCSRIKLSWDDQLALVKYVQQNLAGRRSRPEFVLLDMKSR